MEQGSQEAKGGATHKPESTGVAGVVESVKEKAQDLASSVASRAEDAWDSTRQGAQRAYSAVADTTGNAIEGLNDYMSRYPYLTLMVGFGLGFLVAQAFSFGREGRRYS
jgi:ElaB/YqjD/DUF883 family membrane-anchored ribosome-binding protein